MTSSEITIAIVASVLGVALTILNIIQFFKNDKKDGKNEAQEVAAMKTDLVYIKDGIGELKNMMQLQSKEQTEMKVKVQKIEDRVESIETRMATMEKNGSSSRKGV